MPDARLIQREAVRLAAVMQQNRQPQRLRRRNMGQRAQCVLPHIIAVVRIMLVEAVHCAQLGKQDEQHVRIRAQDVRRALPAQQLRQFNADALGSDVRQRMAQVVRRLTGGVINPETVHGREPQRAQNPQRILGEARFGVADGADNARAQILLPVKGVHQPGLRIPCHGVDGEIAPGKVVHHIRDKRHAVRVAMVSVSAIDAEGRHFIGNTVVQDGQRAVLQAGFNHAAVRKNSLHLLRARAGANIPVMREQPKQTVTYASADNVGVKAVFRQPAQDKIRSSRDCQQENPPPFGNNSIIIEETAGCKGFMFDN